MGDQSLNLSSIETLETQLQNLLKPVKPRPAFINRLESKLTTSNLTILEHRPALQAYYVLVLGLLIGVFLFWIANLLIPRRK